MITGVALAVPWVAALALALLDGRRRAVGWLGIAGLAGTLGVLIAAAVDAADGELARSVAGGFPADIGIMLRADALGTAFAALSVALLLAALAFEVRRGVLTRTFPALVTFLAAGLTGLFLTADAFNFYVFFELSVAASFGIAFYRRSPRELRAGFLFAAVNLLGSLLFLVAVIGLYRITGSLGMDAIAAEVARLDASTSIVLAALMLAAFSLKLGLFPFHTWLPPVYQAAGAAPAAILSGVVANIGAYGLIRFGADVLAPQLSIAQSFLFGLGGASILYGGILAASRTAFPSVLAYSSISQVGYILVALAIDSRLAVAAAVVYAFVNSLNKTLLFLSTGTQGALAAVAVAFGAFSVAGLPPSAGFFAKAALFRAGADAGSVVALVLVALGSALSFLYMFRGYQSRFWARQPPAATTETAVVPVLALAAGVLALGVWPAWLLQLGDRVAAAIGGTL